MLCARVATLADAEKLAPKLRKADCQEIKALSGDSAIDALSRGVFYSDVPFVIINVDEYHNETVLGMFGVSTTQNDYPKTGAIWMLASEELIAYGREFAKKSRGWIDALLDHYDLLYNVVDARNTVHIKWLRWCGFIFVHRHEKHGVEQREFIEFLKIKNKEKPYV